MIDRRERPERGAAAVEFALLLPILILLVFGIVEFGRAYNTKVTLTHAAREGVRVLAITQDSAAAAGAAVSAATSLDPADVAVATTPCNPGEPTQVSVSYPFTYDIPLLGTNTINLTETGVMRCGG